MEEHVSIRKAEIGDEEILAGIQTESWKHGFSLRSKIREKFDNATEVMYYKEF